MEEQMRNDEMEIDLIELFHVLLKKAWVILLCLVIGAVTVGGYTKLFVTPQYQATSTIYVLGNSVSMSGVDLTLSNQLNANFSVLAKSRPVMNKIEEKLKADYKYKDLNYSVEQLQGMITIENPSGTSLMRMTATNSDAQLAADIANAASAEEETGSVFVKLTESEKQQMAKVYGDINAACYAGRAYEVVKEAVKQPGYAMWKEYCYPAILYEYLEYIIEDAVRDYNVLSME